MGFGVINLLSECKFTLFSLGLPQCLDNSSLCRLWKESRLFSQVKDETSTLPLSCVGNTAVAPEVQERQICVGPDTSCQYFFPG